MKSSQTIDKLFKLIEVSISRDYRLYPWGSYSL